MPGPYADSSELAEYWRPLSAAESARADVLLAAAGDMIDEEPGADTFVASALHWVSLDMVKRAMIGGGGITQSSQGMADMSAATTYANPMGNLYLTDDERNRLGGYVRGTGFSLKLSSNTRVPPYWWSFQNSSQTDNVSNQPI